MQSLCRTSLRSCEKAGPSFREKHCVCAPGNLEAYPVMLCEDELAKSQIISFSWKKTKEASDC